MLAAACLAPRAGAADAFDTGRLMQLLSAAPGGEVQYTEKKYSALLNTPAVSSGTLSYRRPDTVEKRMTEPNPETFRISGDELYMARRGSERRLSLASQPLFGAIAASLRGVLMGDLSQLQKYFNVKLSGSEAAWQLELTPLDRGIARYVQSISVQGSAGRIDNIETHEANGDSSLLQVKAPKSPAAQ